MAFEMSVLHGLAVVGLLGLAIQLFINPTYRTAKGDEGFADPPIPRQLVPLPFGLWRLVDMVKGVLTHTELDKQVMVTDKYGKTINMSTLGRTFYATADPQNARAITATSFANYDKGNQFISAFSRFLGRGIFVSDGQQWKTHRAMTRPFFAKDKMGGGDDIHILFEPYVNKLIANLERSTGEPMDVQEAFSRYTMDVAGRFLFGSELHCLDQTEPAPFATSFAAGQDFVTWIMRLGPLSSIFLNEKKYEMSRVIVRSYIDELVKGAMLRRKAMGKGAPKFNPDLSLEGLDTETDDQSAEHVTSSEDYNETLLDHMLDITEDEGLVRDEILNILLAGRDTTASLLSSIICFLGMNPQLYQRARKEVLEVAPLDSATPTMSEIRQLPLMKNIVQETLRLRPPVPTDVREAVEDGVLPGGKFRIRKGTAIFVFIYAMHRLKEYWGEDAETFRPDRWEDDKATTKRAILQGAYLPFWGGPRVCLGQQFALNETHYTLFRILQKFEKIELALDKKDWQTRDGPMIFSNVTLQYVGGLWAHLKTAR